ncbi:flagellin N-terminal helical domain-containing protein [Clostridium felsineum]|uniref:Flagellin n=1 Tax=Clostridium felsineum TaxID=36839 RepID=A0A1S8MDE1_9CLOT|nr:flagellin [Clostridium felsineum]URZ00928.1 Flagellin [Clostridium felsineum]URZ06326.1 Flagellin [Clostridium felsineum]URZ11361.1 Flagellin [Clostridium felsineum]URZ16022.1 Flagellin [Clostridium felsineum DSM 794]
MRINHNIAALSLFYEQKNVETEQSGALERISSGLKINSAKDGPSALEKSEKMRMQIRGMQMAARNVQDGVSMFQTAEGGMNNVSEMLERMRDLVLESGDSSKTDSDKKNIQLEIDQIKKGIDDITKNTNFNGKPLIASDEESEITIGNNVGDKVKFSFYDLSSASLGQKDASGKVTNSINDLNLETNSLNQNLDTIDTALSTVLDARAQYGAIENRFNDTYNDLNTSVEGVQQAESDIRDSDVAEEMITYTKTGVLMQAGDAMLAQANQFPRDILNILSNVK